MDTGKGTGELRGQDTLPPLIEKLSPDRNGPAEFAQLTDELFRPLDVRRVPGGDAGRSLYAASFTYPGPNVLAEAEHLPGFEGPVFFISAWSTGRIEIDLGAELEKVLRTLRSIHLSASKDAPAPVRKNLVIVIPRDLTAAEESWVSSRKIPPGWTLQAWGIRPARGIPGQGCRPDAPG